MVAANSGGAAAPVGKQPLVMDFTNLSFCGRVTVSKSGKHRCVVFSQGTLWRHAIHHPEHFIFHSKHKEVIREDRWFYVQAIPGAEAAKDSKLRFQVFYL